MTRKSESAWVFVASSLPPLLPPSLSTLAGGAVFARAPEFAHHRSSSHGRHLRRCERHRAVPRLARGARDASPETCRTSRGRGRPRAERAAPTRRRARRRALLGRGRRRAPEPRVRPPRAAIRGEARASGTRAVRGAAEPPRKRRGRIAIDSIRTPGCFIFGRPPESRPSGEPTCFVLFPTTTFAPSSSSFFPSLQKDPVAETPLPLSSPPGPFPPRLQPRRRARVPRGLRLRREHGGGSRARARPPRPHARRHRGADVSPLHH